MQREHMGSEAAISAVAALDDRLRSGMYAFIRRARRPVTREEAADAVGISRKLAAFHLDKLVAAGLLHAGAASGGGRVGRAPKVYEPVDDAVGVSIPARLHVDLTAILIDAVVTQREDETAEAARYRVAVEHGHRLAETSGRPSGRLGPERALSVAEAALDEHGYEPYRSTSDCIRLRNCPFHPLAVRAPELVCGINEAFIGGFLDGLHASSVAAVLAPAEGECCVEIRRRA